MERPQRGQWARAQRSSCWPQLQLADVLQRARVCWVLLVRLSATVPISVRVTSLISPVRARSPRERPRSRAMTEKHRT